MSRLVSKRIEKACADLNNFPTSSSISDVQKALATLAPVSDLNCTDPAIYGKAIECKIVDGLINVINPPKNHELYKDADGIFTNEKDGILLEALVLFVTLIKIRRASLHLHGESKSLFPLFPEFKNFLDTLKKMLQRTANPVSLPHTSNNNKNDSNNIEDDDGIDAERKKATTNNEFILNETILIRIRASTHVLAALQRLEPRAMDDSSGLLDFEELLIVEGFHVLALKNIAFGIQALKSAISSSNNDEQHADKGSKMLTTTIGIFLKVAAQTLRTAFEFDVRGRDRVVSKTRWEAVRKLVIHHNLVPFLFYASSVVDDQPAVLDDVPFLCSSLRVLVRCAQANPSQEQLKKWNIPVSEESIVGQRIVQGGFLPSLLRLVKLDSIDKVPQRKDNNHQFILRVVFDLLLVIDVKFYFHPFLEMDGVAMLTKLIDHESDDVRSWTMTLASEVCSHGNEWNDRANITELFLSCGIVEKLTRIVSIKSHGTDLRRVAVLTLMIIVYFLRTDEFPELDDEQEKRQQRQRIAELHQMLIEQKLHIAVADAASVFMTEDFIDKPQSSTHKVERSQLGFDIFGIAYALLENTSTKEQAKQILDAMHERDTRYGFYFLVRSVIKPMCMSTENTGPGVERRRRFIQKYFPELVEDNNGNTKTTDDEVKSDD